MTTSPPFVFDGQECRIVEAEIIATIRDPYWCDTYNNGQDKSISWSISFEAESVNEEFKPAGVDFDGLPIRVNNWHNLVGYALQWTEAINPETDDRYGLTYVYDHLLITGGDLLVTKRAGATFQIIASGLDEAKQKFAINAPATFKGIYVRGSENDTSETIFQRLKEQIDDANLTGTPFKLDHRYDSGVRMGHAFFSPVV